MNEKRLYYLDYYKVYALIMLTFFHFLDFWYTKNTNSFSNSPKFVIQMINVGALVSLFACVTIPMIAGLSFSFQKKDIKSVLKRSFSLIAIGYWLNICLYGFSNLYEWDILQAIGLFTLMTSLITSQRKYFLIFGMVLIGFSKMISMKFYASNLTMGKFLDFVIIGDPNGESYYSIVHFYGLYLIGYYLGTDLKNIYKNLKYIFCITIIFVPMKHNILSPTFDNLWSANFFMPTVQDMFLFLFLSVTFLMFLIKIDLYFKNNKISKYLVKVSKNMTSIYVFHTIIFVYISSLLSDIDNFYVKLILFISFAILQLIFVLMFPLIRDLVVKNE